MADITGINVSEAEQVTANITNTTTSFSKALNDLTAVLTEHDGCWGNDSTGKSFAKQYVPNSQQYLSKARDLETQLAQTAQDVSTIPGRFEQADGHNGTVVSGT
jgi:hypothetical protein